MHVRKRSSRILAFRETTTRYQTHTTNSGLFNILPFASHCRALYYNSQFILYIFYIYNVSFVILFQSFWSTDNPMYFVIYRCSLRCCSPPAPLTLFPNSFQLYALLFCHGFWPYYPISPMILLYWFLHNSFKGGFFSSGMSSRGRSTFRILICFMVIRLTTVYCNTTDSNNTHFLLFLGLTTRVIHHPTRQTVFMLDCVSVCHILPQWGGV